MMQESMKFKVGIVGHGFVGRAVQFGFDLPTNETMCIDPKYGNTLDDLIEWQPAMTFVCLPTPMTETGEIDSTEIVDYILELITKTQSIVVLKSTVTPNIIGEILGRIASVSPPPQDPRDNLPVFLHRFCYNPEFLTEVNASAQFIHPEFIIFGSTPEGCQLTHNMYDRFSRVSNLSSSQYMSPIDAAFVKYGINSFLAMKVTFFNQLYDAVVDTNGAFQHVVRGMTSDPRIGKSHTAVPGFDGKRGFGGACFPKDIKAFNSFTDKMTILDSITEINKKYRSLYELTNREKEQNVTYE